MLLLVSEHDRTTSMPTEWVITRVFGIFCYAGAMAVDVLPGSRVRKGKIVGSYAYNGAISFVEVFDGDGKGSTEEVQKPPSTARGRILWSGIPRQRMEVQVVEK